MKSIDSANKSKKGRPAVDTEAVNVRLPRDILDAIEEFQRGQSPIPNRPTAIRHILTEWLREKEYLPDAE